MYRKLHLISPALIDFENFEFSEKLQNIQHLVLENFIFNESLLQKFNGILKLEIIGSLNDGTNIYEFIQKQKKSLKELSIVGSHIEPQIIQKLLEFENLTKIELEIEIVEVNQNILFSRNWRKFKLLNPQNSHKTFMFKAVESLKGK